MNTIEGLQNINHLGLSSQDLLEGVETGLAKTIWVGGSVVEGLGNPYSDIDVFVLVDHDDSDDFKLKSYDGYEVDIRYFKNRRIDYEYWKSSSVNNLLNRFNEIDFGSEKINVLGMFTDEGVTFLHRLLKGICIFNTDVFAKLRCGIAEKRLASYLFELKSLYVDDAFDDTAGIYLTGDYRTAALRARQLVEFSIDCLLHCYGETNTSEKYRLPMMRRLTDANSELSSYYTKYWQILSTLHHTYRGCKNYVEMSLAFSEELIRHTYFVMDRRVVTKGYVI